MSYKVFVRRKDGELNWFWCKTRKLARDTAKWWRTKGATVRIKKHDV